MRTIKKLSLSLVLLLSGVACAQETQQLKHVIGPFGTLNDTDNPMVIESNQAQDLLNVDIGPRGNSIKKRDGYGVAYTLTYTTSAVHGIYKFYDSNGSDVQLFAHDSRLTASVSGGTLDVLFSTGTTGATYQCTDAEGYAYCVNTGRDGLIKTNGATYSKVDVSTVGTIITSTPERLVMAGFASYPNRIDFSHSNDFTSWDLGNEPTDPYQVTVVAPGAKITHLTYAFGRVLWFKDSSFGYVMEGATHGDWVLEIVSPNVGSIDNSSVFWGGQLYFRGQDSHFYAYDGANLVKLSKDIETIVSQSQSRLSNSWEQTSQSDWESGTQTPTGWGDTTTTAGSLTNKTTDFVITASTDFAAGSYDSMDIYYDTTTTAGTLALTFPDPFNNFRDGTSGTKRVWVKNAEEVTVTVADGQITMNSSVGLDAYISVSTPIANFAAGTSFYWLVSDLVDDDPAFDAIVDFSLGFGDETQDDYYVYGGGSGTDNNAILLYFKRHPDNQQAIQLRYVSRRENGSSQQTTVLSGQLTVPATVYLHISTSNWAVTINGSLIKSGTHSIVNIDPYPFIGVDPSFDSTVKFSAFGITRNDFIWTSKSYDTGLASSYLYWDDINISETDSDGVISYQTRSSDDGNTWDAWTNVSGTTIGSDTKRYFQTRAIFNDDGMTGSAESVQSISFGGYSSGSWVSDVHAASSLTAWDDFDADYDNDGGAHTFYIRAGTNTFTESSSTPSWTAISAGDLPSISTGSYFQIKDVFTATESSHTPSLNSFAINWFEGSATDKAYVTYFDDAIWWALASGAGATTNNKILKWDLDNSGWLVYDIDANGFLERSQSLYFGSAAGGYVYKYGSLDSDNGTAINAYWKSKDFILGDPFVDKSFDNISIVADSVESSSVTVTYSIDGSSSTSYTVPLYNSASSFKMSNQPLPFGKTGKTINVQVGNNAVDQPFEIFGIQIGYRPWTWRPE